MQQNFLELDRKKRLHYMATCSRQFGFDNRPLPGLYLINLSIQEKQVKIILQIF